MIYDVIDDFFSCRFDYVRELEKAERYRVAEKVRLKKKILIKKNYFSAFMRYEGQHSAELLFFCD